MLNLGSITLIYLYSTRLFEYLNIFYSFVSRDFRFYIQFKIRFKIKSLPWGGGLDIYLKSLPV